MDEVLAPCRNVTRFRVYNLASESDSPEHQEHFSKIPLPLDRRLTNVAFNHCSINHREIRNIFHASQKSLKSLSLEYPTALPEDDLLALLAYVGQGLRSLSVHDFAQGMSLADYERKSHIVEGILHNCPNLHVLNFPDAVAAKTLPNALIGSKLKLWAFTCGADVRPQDWLHAFQKPGFPTNASCRVYVKGKKTTLPGSLRSSARLSLRLCVGCAPFSLQQAGHHKRSGMSVLKPTRSV